MEFPQILATLENTKTKPTGLSCIQNLSGAIKPQGIIFLKPEVCALSAASLQCVYEHFQSLCHRHHVNLLSAHVLSGEFISKYQIFAKNYETICQYASIDLASEDVRNVSLSRIMKNHDECERVVGGLSLVKQGLTPNVVLKLWQSGQAFKIQEDMYGVVCEYDLKTILLVNGFYPVQKVHCENADNQILLFTFQTLESFDRLKSHLQGSIEPDGRYPESLRHFLYKNKKQLGLSVFSASQNGIHLSGSPEEGQLEAAIFLNAINEDLCDRKVSRCQPMS